MNNADALDKLQNTVINEDKKKNESTKYPQYHFDRLKMYFGKTCEIVKNISISIPTIGDILEIGEENFYHSLSPFLYNSTSIRLFLWDNNIDWCTVSDIMVFAMLLPTVDKEPLKLLFKDISFEDFQLMELNENDGGKKYVMVSPSQNILLTEEDYLTVAEYVREIVNVHPKVEKVKGKTTKKWIIQEDRMNLQQKKPTSTSTLLPLVSTCVNHPGFKYKLEELEDVGICQFMDSVQRLQVYESSRALLSGSYSGFCDTSKIPKEQFNFFRDTYQL